ncbi:MAG: TetR/AcrR family transcriptional regulator [Actinomycetes bacterium]
MPAESSASAAVRDARPHERPDQRRRVLLAAVDAFAERGADGVRLKDISDRVGMSPGHILYYFGRKDRVLLETLRWSENELAEQRRVELAKFRSPWRAIERFVELYLPVSALDPRWNLWAQVSVRPPVDVDDQRLIADLEGEWARDLADWVTRGIGSGAFSPPTSPPDADAFAQAFALRWVLLMNGSAEEVRLQGPGHDTRWARMYALHGMAS